MKSDCEASVSGTLGIDLISTIASIVALRTPRLVLYLENGKRRAR